MLEGLRGEDSIAELCRREGSAQSSYYGWSKEFLQGGKNAITFAGTEMFVIVVCL